MTDSSKQNDWTKGAAELTGPRFAKFQVELTKYNAARFQPGLPEDTPPNQLTRESRIAEAEIIFVEALRAAVAPPIRTISTRVLSGVRVSSGESKPRASTPAIDPPPDQR